MSVLRRAAEDGGEPVASRAFLGVAPEVGAGGVLNPTRRVLHALLSLPNALKEGLGSSWRWIADTSGAFAESHAELMVAGRPLRSCWGSVAQVWGILTQPPLRILPGAGCSDGKHRDPQAGQDGPGSPMAVCFSARCRRTRATGCTKKLGPCFLLSPPGCFGANLSGSDGLRDLSGWVCVSVQSLEWGSSFSKGSVKCQAARLALWHGRRKALMSY